MIVIIGVLIGLMVVLIITMMYIRVSAQEKSITPIKLPDIKKGDELDSFNKNTKAMAMNGDEHDKWLWESGIL